MSYQVSLVILGLIHGFKKLTSTLAILGDSLFDAQNTFTLSSLLGQNPFSDPIYDGGGNTKASDGLVLGEQIAIEMGGIISDAQNFTVLSFDSPSSVDVHNYAHAGARSGQGREFSLSITTESIGVGLSEQVKAFQNRKDFYKATSDVDAIIGCGGNDLLDSLGLVEEIKAAAETSTLADDIALAMTIAKPIASNLRMATKKVSRLADEVVVIGSLSITETPEVQGWSLLFTGNRTKKRALGIIERAENIIDRRLNKVFNNDSTVSVIKGTEIRNSLDQISFVDTIHPDTATSQEIAEVIVADASRSLSTFGF